MAKKTYYESGDCYLDAKNRRMSKDGLKINIRDEKLAKNLHFRIAYETGNSLMIPFKSSIDSKMLLSVIEPIRLRLLQRRVP